MAHHLVTLPPATTSPLPSTQKQLTQWCCTPNFHRRAFIFGLISSGMGSSLAQDIAIAAKRRPPPLPPVEKKDPNMGAVQAKVLASIKRKEEMKEQIAKLREKGKPIS